MIVVCSRAASRTAVQALEAAGVDVIVATGENESARVAHALDELGARDVQSLLLEGGPHLAGAFLEAGEIDEVRMFIAPVMLGGREARTVVEGIGVGDDRRRAARALAHGDRADRRRRADRRAAEGVVSGVHRAGGRQGRSAVEPGATARACGARRRSPRSSRAGDSIAVNGVCLTARRRRRRLASPPT